MKAMSSSISPAARPNPDDRRDVSLGQAGIIGQPETARRNGTPPTSRHGIARWAMQDERARTRDLNAPVLTG